jgi:hypothetical protein
MRTLTLSVSDKAYEKLKVIFSLFKKDDLQLVEDDVEQYRLELQKQRAEVKSGKAKFIDIDDAERQLDELIAAYENRI